MTTDSLESYYKVLGISSKSTVDEIKRSYRQKAKELHPDKNNSPNAQEQFILLTEAYECLTNIESRKSKQRKSAQSYSDWQYSSRERARHKAREYAEMEFENFKKTEYYKNSQAAFTVFEHLYFFAAVAVLFSPIWGYIYKEWIGLGVGVFFTFLLVHFWAGIFTEKINLNIFSFFNSLILVIKTKTFLYIVISLVNLFILFRVTLNTQLTITWLAFILLAFYAMTYLAYKIKVSVISKFSNVGLYLCYTPSIFNILFLINFVFSSNPKVEVYSFIHEKRMYGGRQSKARLEKIAYIDLANDKYEEYKWFRMFFDFESMKDKSEITYTFEDGLLGLRVLKQYDFTK